MNESGYGRSLLDTQTTDPAKLLKIQIFSSVALAGLVWYGQGSESAVASFGGGVIAIGNSLLMARRLKRIRSMQGLNPQMDVTHLYMGAMERFGWTLIAMGLAMGWFMLQPPWLMLGFGLAYMAYPLSKL